MKNRIAFVLVLTLLFFGCQNKQPKITYFSGNAFGTNFKIQIFDANSKITPDEVDSIFTLFNLSLSNYQDNSLLSYFNRNEYHSFPFSEYATSDTLISWLNKMILESKIIYNATDGYFDPSAEAIFSYWKRGKNEDFMLDSSEINNLLQHRGMHLFEVSDDKPYKTDSLSTLNFNAIAKGFALDVLHHFFESKGLENYLIEIGGEIRLKGKPLEKDFFNIAINQPKSGEDVNSAYKILSVGETSIATSGNYRDFYYLDNQIIGHTINPKDGFPAKNSLLSVTVFHKECAIADAYATAFMAMGLEKAIAVLNSQKELSAFFIFDQNGGLADTLITGAFNPIITP